VSDGQVVLIHDWTRVAAWSAGGDAVAGTGAEVGHVGLVGCGLRVIDPRLDIDGFLHVLIRVERLWIVILLAVDEGRVLIQVGHNCPLIQRPISRNLPPSQFSFDEVRFYLGIWKH